MKRLQALARRVSNWGRWGPDDERGTVNYITPEVVRRGAACVKRGEVFSLGLSFGAAAPQIGQGGRTNPVHAVTATDGRLGADPEGPRYADDAIAMPLQCATQWDSLAHVYYDGRLYNGAPATTLGAAGAERNAIDKIGCGIVSRGVLLDLARARGVPPSARRACAPGAATSSSSAPGTSPSSPVTATARATCGRCPVSASRAWSGCMRGRSRRSPATPARSRSFPSRTPPSPCPSMPSASATWDSRWARCSPSTSWPPTAPATGSGRSCSAPRRSRGRGGSGLPSTPWPSSEIGIYRPETEG